MDWLRGGGGRDLKEEEEEEDECVRALSIARLGLHHDWIRPTARVEPDLQLLRHDGLDVLEQGRLLGRSVEERGVDKNCK